MSDSARQPEGDAAAGAPAQRARLEIWRREDCAALAALCGLWGVWVWAGSLGGTALGEPIRVDDPRAKQVAEKIDANTAGVASLRRLPMIGPVKARAIVEFRRNARRGASGQVPDRPVFRYREDLTAVLGIGPQTVRRAGAWLAQPPGPAAAAAP